MKGVFLYAILMVGVSETMCQFAEIWDIFEYLLENQPHPNTENSETVDPVKYDYDLTGTAACAQLAGCKTLNYGKGCYGPSGGLQDCDKCFHFARPHRRNVMRSDFFNYDRAYIKKCGKHPTSDCPSIEYVDEILEHMILIGDDVAQTYQGAVWRELNVPDFDFQKHYETKFCDAHCVMNLRDACTRPTVLTHISQWCHNILDLIINRVPHSKGPASYIMFLASLIASPKFPKVTISKDISTCRNGEECKWPYYNLRAEFEEKAVLVASAAASFLLAGNWWSNVDIETHIQFQEFGFAVQHSLMLAVFSGRLRLTLHPRRPVEARGVIEPGVQLLFDEKNIPLAANFDGSIGKMYATLCAMFYQTKDERILLHRKLRYRPEIHVMNNQGCVERTSGMIFIRPGDWVTETPKYSVLGSAGIPMGVQFSTDTNLTTFEFTGQGVNVYPPSVSAVLKETGKTLCTNAVGNGPNLFSIFNKQGLRGIGGICNWVAVW